MYQRARAEKSEVQNLIYGDANTNQKNYMRQNYEELKQIQRETQQRIQQNSAQMEKNWKLRKFRDVKPKLSKTGVLHNQSYTDVRTQPREMNRSRTQENNRSEEQKANNMKDNRIKNKAPLKQGNIKIQQAAPRKKSTLQSAGENMLNSSIQKQGYKVGAYNPPPLEQPNVVYYTPESKEDIHSLIPQIDPAKAHRDKYIPRNIAAPRVNKPVSSVIDEEVKMQRKEAVPTDKGFIAPKKDKNFIKANFNQAVDEDLTKVKARAAVAKQEDNSNVNNNYGKVPKYLQKFNANREKEAKRKKQDEEDKDVSWLSHSL